MILKQATNILKKEGLLPKNALSELKEYERLKLGNILDFCRQRGLATNGDIVTLLTKSYQMPVINLSQVEIDLTVARLLPASVCFEHRVIPFYQNEGQLYVAMADPDKEELIAYIEKKTALKVTPYLAEQKAIEEILQLTFNNSADDNQRHILELIEQAKKLTHQPEEMAKQVPIISLMNHFILYGLRLKASDMHIEPREDKVRIRFRIDGLLHELFCLPVEIHASLVARLKIMARLRIDEHLRPQDGRFSFNEAGYRLAVRASTIPTLYGEKVALRFLDTENDQLSFESLGLSGDHINDLKNALGFTSGLILVTGPTGSGKTTTLYSFLKGLEENKVNISTIEDPIEYHLKEANQIQVNPAVDLTFANGLRSILRQDPDIIMVGEIRDKETAQMAINAALTGHLVLSSLHTNSASAAIPRLFDMGIESFLIASTLRMVIGQRLVRCLCPTCKEEYTLAAWPENFAKHTSQSSQDIALSLARAKGCPKCLNTGFISRTGIFEILKVDDQMHDLIISRARAEIIEKAAREKGMKTLIQDGLEKAADKKTTLEEITRVIK